MTDGDTDEGRAAVAALRALARSRPDDVELLDGFPDAELDGWPVPVPAAVRTVLCEIGGVTAGGRRYVFGPRGSRPNARVFGDGYWTLGQLEYENELIVGVPDEPAADWGPLLVVNLTDQQEITVEAPAFTGWLTGLAGWLDDGRDEDRSGPEVLVQAAPSIDAALGRDAELAALVGRGGSLTDVVDLRALPAYPCGVTWEPYHSTDGDTADTSGSEIDLRLVGAGRALLISTMVSGDYLCRPVRRHPVPADAPRRAVAELRALAADLPGLVSIDEGCADAEMDGWPVPVPEEIRVVLREIGGIRMAGLPALRLLPGAPEHEVGPEVHRMLGGDGSYWPIGRVEYGRQAALAQVRVDPRTGEWGYVVSVSSDRDNLRDYPELTLIGETLPELLLTIARIGRAAAGRPDFARHVEGETDWFFPNTGQPWVLPVPVADAADRLPAEVTELPAGAYVADLRDAPIPTDLCFYRVDGWSYRARLDRFHFADAGRIVAAAPAVPDDAPRHGRAG